MPATRRPPPSEPSAGTGPDASAGADTRVDGRRARRERNREAVVDALLGFYREGVLQPSTDQVAERAGISARSLFRYFDDVDDLCRAAIARQFHHVGELFFVDVDPELGLAERAASFVAQRLDLYEAMSWVGVVARAREPFQPLIAAELRQARAILRRQVRDVFAAELDGLDPADAGRRVAAADVLCSFEAYRLLFDDHGLDRAAIADVLVGALVRQLAPQPAP